MDFNKMNGYQFEVYIGELFSKMGFNVLNTTLSADGGIDIVAIFPDDVFKGKYIIQCKHWKVNVGEPAVRDLYGVVLSENANKGILIATSDFTKGALQFASGKNIELIDGAILGRLCKRYLNFGIDSEAMVSSSEAYFLNNSKFDKAKFEHLNELITEDKKNMKLHLALINFLLNYYKNENIRLIHAGLNEHLLETMNRFSNQFVGKKVPDKVLNCFVQTIKSFTYLIDGKLSLAFSCLYSNYMFFDCYSNHGALHLEYFNKKSQMPDEALSQEFVTSTNFVKVVKETDKFNIKHLMICDAKGVRTKTWSH